MKIVERRFINNELRVKKTDDGGKKIVGYAAKFAPNARSEDLGGFVEELHPNVFNKCLTANPDVRCLWNHDANHVLGRTIAGTLRLSVDGTGLQYECDPPDTQVARDLMTSMERKDVDNSSFGFICVSDSWREDPVSGEFIRTVLEAELFDVSPVTYPAYLSATSGVRSLGSKEADEAIGAKLAELRAASEARSHKKTKSVDGVELTAESFAYVGDSSDPETWKLPINFPGDDQKTKSHIKDALARFDQTEGIPDGEKQKVHDKIVAAAKEHGIQVSEEKSAPAVSETRTEEAAGVVVDPAGNQERRDDDEPVCICICTPCVDGDCSGCDAVDCDSEYCSACPMQEQRAAVATERAAGALHLSRLRLKLAQVKEV